MAEVIIGNKPQLRHCLPTVSTTHLGPDTHAIINQDWRYIHDNDHAEEPYDVRKDPHECNNLADFAAVKRKPQDSAPRSFSPAGTPRNQLWLIVEDDRFHWARKRNKNANRK